VERLHSFPADEIGQALASFPSLREVVWCQEEPRNMGAWTFVASRLQPLLLEGVSLRYVGRPDRASPAEGYHAAHLAEQARIVASAID
jgi:2-oxoglutarate dehydrogenase E1 component